MEARASHTGQGTRPGPGSTTPRLLRFVPGIAVTGGALAPFLISGLAWHRYEGEIEGAGLIGGCPMLELTGLPCITCGGARAFYHLTHGDGAFLDYNWLWPVVALLAIGYGILLLARAARGEEPFGVRARSIWRRYATEPVRMAALTLGVLAVPWVVAFANLDAIRSG